MRLIAALHERTDTWLRKELDQIWERHFVDVPRANEVEIAFARRWKYRMGMIALSESTQRTYVGINHLLRSALVPDYVPAITIAHELVHYAHGFGSPLPQLYDDPHAGNIVPKELLRRGLGRELAWYNEWTSAHWFFFYENYRRLTQRRRATGAIPRGPIRFTPVADVAAELAG